MTPAALSVITITDGTTTATLTDTTKYGLLGGGWAPQVATRRVSTLGGRPYSAVTEEIRLDVYGSTTADALSNLAVIAQLIDQADRWYRGEAVDPVRIEYRPQGSTMTAIPRSLIFGFADGAGPVNLPVTFNDALMVYEIRDVSVRFVRDGAWYDHAEDTFQATSTSHPSVASGSFAASASHLSPVVIEFGSFPDVLDLDAYDTAYLLVADRASRLQIIEAEDLATPPINQFTTDADAARKPSGTGVLVYTPIDTSEDNTASGTVTVAAGKRIGIVAAVRNSHASTTFAVRVEISGPAERSLATTRPYLVDTATTDPRIVLLGVVLCEETYANIRLYVTASAAAGTLSIDYLALINLDDPTSRILAIGPLDLNKSIASPETSMLRIDPRPLTARSPQVRQVGTIFPTIKYAVPDWYRGDAYLLSIGTTIAAIYCGRNASGGYWRAWNPSTAASIDGDFNFMRRTAYLVPV